MSAGRNCSAEPLYLLCGMMCDETVWAPLLRLLTRRFDVRPRQFRGFDSLDEMAASVLATAPGRFALAGHSMGGRVALEVYRQAGERISRLALLDTGFHLPDRSESDRRRQLVELARSEGMAAVARAWIPSILHPDRAKDETLVRSLTAMVLRNTPESLAGQVHALLDRADVQDVLPRINRPALLCCGREDGWAPASRHEETARIIPGAQLAILEKCGHMTTMEQPKAVGRLLLEWSESG